MAVEDSNKSGKDNLGSTSAGMWLASEMAEITEGQWSPDTVVPMSFSGCHHRPSKVVRNGLLVLPDVEHWGEAYAGNYTQKIQEAQSLGATGLVASNGAELGNIDIPVLWVEDSLTALRNLAREARNRCTGKIVCFIGTGPDKGELKRILTTQLGARFHVKANTRSMCRPTGILSSLSQIPPKTDFILMELHGSNARSDAQRGELLRPDVVVVGEIGPSEKPLKLSRLLEYQTRLLKGAKGPAIVVVNKDSIAFPFTAKKVADNGHKLLTYGRGEADICLLEHHQSATGSIVKINAMGLNISLQIESCKHQDIDNALAAIASLTALDLSSSDYIASISSLDKLSFKSRTSPATPIELAGNNIALLDHAGAPMPVALQALAEQLREHVQGGKRTALVIAKFVAWNELAERYHKGMVRVLGNTNDIDILVLDGDPEIAQCVLDEYGHGQLFSKPEDLIKHLTDHADQYTAVALIGNSKGADNALLRRALYRQQRTEVESSLTRQKSHMADFYDQRYSNNAYDMTEISDDEQAAIGQLVQRIAKHRKNERESNRPITLIDCGCGDGRLHPLYEQLAQQLKQRATTLQIIGMDLSAEALKTYRSRCMENDYQTVAKLDELQPIGALTDTALPPVHKGNLTVFFKTADAMGVSDFAQQEISCDLIVCAAVINHVLGPQNRADILRAFAASASTCYISLATAGDFSSIQAKFSVLRERKLELLTSLESITLTPEQESSKRVELASVTNTLGGALAEGEIYYKARLVRDLGEKLPELGDLDIPFFGTDVAGATEMMQAGDFKYMDTYKGAFGRHKRWIIALASNLVPVS